MFATCFDRPGRLDCWGRTAEIGMMVEPAGDVLGVDTVDRFGHVQNLGFPSVLPT